MGGLAIAAGMAVPALELGVWEGGEGDLEFWRDEEVW